MKIDFTSKNFKFVSNNGEYYIGDTKCVGDYTEWNSTKKVEDGWGMFEGLTMVTFKGYDGPLPRMDEDTCSFSEFSIYYKEVMINEYKYSDLESMIIMNNREDKIDKIWK
jgi:hypothetical protein